MVTIDEIRAVATLLSGVEESQHFRLPTFKVNGKGFITIQTGAAILALPQPLSEALAEDNPASYEVIWRNGRFFVGTKVNLRSVSIHDLKPLIEEAYKNRQ
jgi:hypothetical protein